MSSPALHRYRAERLLRKQFSGLRAKVLGVVRSQLRAKGVRLDPADLEACYAQAWQGLYATVLGGEEVENPSAWLVLVTFRRAIDESRSRSGIELGVQADGVGALEGRLEASHPDFAAEIDNRTRLRGVFEGMRARLSPRECEAASLCYLQGFSRAEAAERMGISESRMRKLMEGAGSARPGVAGKVGELLATIESGGWCEQQSSLMRAFAFGILEPGGERHGLAAAHCRECPACRAHVASLRGLAAVLPLPLLSPLALAGAVGAGRAGTGTSGAAARGAAGGPAGAASTGATRAPRLTAGWLRVGARAGANHSSGLTASLTVKLAVTAMLVLGAGYGLLGTRAHGSVPTRAHSSAGGLSGRSATPHVAASETLAQTLLPPLPVAAGLLGSNRRSSIARPRSLRAPYRARSTAHASAHEFAPERVTRETNAPLLANAPPSPSPTQTGSAPPAHEFGIE